MKYNHEIPTFDERPMAVHIICGGRTFDDTESVDELLDCIQSKADEAGVEPVVIHGAASGADTLAAKAATDREWLVIPVPAPWKTFGKAAGYIRNREMAHLLNRFRDRGHPVAVVAFPGGDGTKSMIDIAHEFGFKSYRTS